jgi:hypothetical protein
MKTKTLTKCISVYKPKSRICQEHATKRWTENGNVILLCRENVQTLRHNPEEHLHRCKYLKFRIKATVQCSQSEQGKSLISVYNAKSFSQWTHRLAFYGTCVICIRLRNHQYSVKCCSLKTAE